MTRLVAVLLLLIVLAVSAASPVHAAPATISDFEIVLKNIIELLTPAAAIAFLAMVIVGAYRFITSGGSQQGTAGARNTLTYAMIGILLVASAVLILRLVTELTGRDVTQVNIVGDINNPSGPCTRDYNRDGIIDSADLAILATHYPDTNLDPKFDFNGDGKANAIDTQQLAKLVGTKCN